MITLGMIMTVAVLAAAQGAAVATPLWATILMSMAGPIFLFLTAWATGFVNFQTKKVELDGNTRAKIEEVTVEKTRDANAYALAQLEAFSKRIDQQDKKIASLEHKERISEDYMEVLRQHISNGNPPPPPSWPDFNGSHALGG